MENKHFLFIVLFCIMTFLSSPAWTYGQELSKAAFVARNKEGAQFSWPAFQRFWNRGPGVANLTGDGSLSLKNATKNTDGYAVHFRHAIRLYIPVNANGMITSAEVFYTAKPEYYSGGSLFLKLIEHMIVIGTYQWKPAVRNDLRIFLNPMTPARKVFQHKGMLFVREQKGNIWSFRMQFVPYSEEILNQS